ncbi:MAG: ImmA/IrrE family metallo-endopeptidase [Akkermansiaceae bacterium]|nr:ImmA/IrrE family metallo-endopeptidase [Akkermansiaceae bacterium]MCF7730584.1 ImmA/IrrE family metallo-endopeptidase [Akkermansiaceae bacterium]
MYPSDQLDMFDAENARTLLDRLLEDSRLYKDSKDYIQLLDFIVRMPNFAPFNAMLLQIQKPGIQFAASKFDWHSRFGATVNEGARPLLILWPFAPVALVYDVVDVVGRDIPEDAHCFVAHGPITEDNIQEFWRRMNKKSIIAEGVDLGDGVAGSISRIASPLDSKTRGVYRIKFNTCHSPPVRFVTIAHELAHLFLGHLGVDRAWNVTERRRVDHDQKELEAESVAYLVSKRSRVESKSETYLSDYVGKHDAIGTVDLYQVTRAAGQIESLLGLGAHTRFDPAKKCDFRPYK